MQDQNRITKNENLAPARNDMLDIINQLYYYYIANCNRILTFLPKSTENRNLKPKTLRIRKHNILFKLLYSLQ